ncbi:MAG: hypothetical protein ACR652_22710 [Methylocystis sp.]|uniref:hypothetical protein n=1 Tax=Methylocystis sp. TaxID=1911079 RepID=UPI003DA4A603
MSINNTTLPPFQNARQKSQTTGPETVGRHPETGATIAVGTVSGQAPVQESQAGLQTHLSPEAQDLQRRLDQPATALADHVTTLAPSPSPSPEIIPSESDASRTPGTHAGDADTERTIHKLVSETPLPSAMHADATQYLTLLCASRAPEGPQERAEFLAEVVKNMVGVHSSHGPAVLADAMQKEIAYATGSHPEKRLEAQGSLDDVQSEKASSRNELLSRLEDIPFSTQSACKLVRYHGRVFAAAKFGNFRMPFYLSSGARPKPGVVPGRWYPFFGLGPDSWINKFVKGMPHYYWSPKLTEVAQKLDATYGDIRENPGVPEVSEVEPFAAFMNKSMLQDPVERAKAGASDFLMNMHMVGLLDACDDPDKLSQEAVAAAKAIVKHRYKGEAAFIDPIAKFYVKKFTAEAPPEQQDKRNQ